MTAGYQRFCSICGGVIDADAATCSTGHPVQAPAAGPSSMRGVAPPSAAPTQWGEPHPPHQDLAYSSAPPMPEVPPQVGAPDWLAKDWQLVGATILVWGGVAALIGIVYGIVVGATVGRSMDAALGGLVGGAYLVFASVGSRVDFAIQRGDETVAYLIDFIPLGLLVIPVAATAVCVSYAAGRLPESDRARIRSFPVKLGLGTAALVGVLALVLARDGDGGGIATEVDAGWAMVGTFVVVTSTAFLRLVNRDLLERPFATASAEWVRRGQFLATGMRAFVVVAAAGAFICACSAVVLSDSDADRAALVATAPVYALNVGAQFALVVQGASTDVVAGRATSPSISGAGGDRLSLFEFGLPPDAGSDSPGFLAAALLVMVVAVSAVVYRRLSQSRPDTEQQAIGLGFCAALGLVCANVAAAAVGQIAFAGGLEPADLGGSLESRPSLAGALGVGALWGVVASVGVAFVWARAHGLEWQQTGSPSMPAAALVEQPLAAPAATRICPTCQTHLPATAKFCASCGGQVGVQ